LLPRELRQQQVLVMSMIPALDHMSKVDREAKLKITIEERNKSERDNVVKIEVEDESSSSSLMSMYSTESDRKGSEVSSRQSPTLLEVQIPDKH
jgi:hypothetical protein